MTRVGAVRSIVLECRDPEPLAEFWSQVLGQEIDQREDDWWSLERQAGGPRLAFQVVEAFEPPPWPGRSGEQQVHLDIEVDDLTAGTDDVVRLGAHILSDVVDPDQDPWRVFADPAGHPFCLVSFG
ncbi:VOC family protein [Aeromicrobium sp. S22]|uniref:VOC family protein n=1 Tax=Aeromicrobium sp. S22 TaxID=2662029 RepID=UPI00129E982F|nr:VOC family protein [Aeromicrobium sp. S22]